MEYTGSKPKMSVWLDNSRSDELKKFHCSVCGKVVFEYYNDVNIILPGEMGKVGKSPIVIQCHGAIVEWKDGVSFNSKCKAKYWIE